MLLHEEKETPRKSTRASLVASSLLKSILRGELAPGSKLNIDYLREVYQVSLSPMREAISRLVSTGLVEFEDQRGYRVAPVSLQLLAEVTRLRSDLESLALRYAIERADLEWESSVLGALHRLNRTERDVSSPEAMEVWETAHWAFHRTLIEGCGMEMLVEFCQNLQNQSDRYRRIFLKKPAGAADIQDEHNAIANAAVDRNADLASKLLRAHIERTGNDLARQISGELPED